MAIVTGSPGNDILDGSLGDDVIRGLAGDDLINGRGGRDRMEGGLGNDIFVVDSDDDLVIELTGEGNDTLYTEVNYRIADTQFVEIMSAREWTSSTSLQLIGNVAANAIFGNAGNNFIDGGGGVDVLTGFAGDDVFVVGDSRSRVIEVNGGGFDTIYTDSNYTLAANSSIELLSARDWRSTSNLILIGNSFDNTIDGNDGINFLDGGGGIDILIGFAGNDIYVVNSADDQVIEGVNEGQDVVYTEVSYQLVDSSFVEALSARDVTSNTPLELVGNSYNNILSANNASNIIDGGAGDDIMAGGGGDDGYYVDSPEDRILENDDGGTDTVYVSSEGSYYLDGAVENLIFEDPSSTANIYLIGNFLANRMVGNAAPNVITASEGDDYLDGLLGEDQLSGGAGSDSFAFTTAIVENDRDTINDFEVGVDKILLDDAIFDLPLGALDASVFVIGDEALDADDRILFDPRFGQLQYDADGTGAIEPVYFGEVLAAKLVPAALTAADIVVI